MLSDLPTVRQLVIAGTGTCTLAVLAFVPVIITIPFSFMSTWGYRCI